MRLLYTVFKLLKFVYFCRQLVSTPFCNITIKLISKCFHSTRVCRFAAVSVMDMDFLSVDINPCPFSIGNEPPNLFAETARCKESTMVSPL